MTVCRIVPVIGVAVQRPITAVLVMLTALMTALRIVLEYGVVTKFLMSVVFVAVIILPVLTARMCQMAVQRPITVVLVIVTLPITALRIVRAPGVATK